VKVDVENAEASFIDGAATEHERIKFLLIELLEPAIRSGIVSRLIHEWGVQAYYINDHSLEHSTDGSFEYTAPQYNWLFCKLDPHQLAARLRGTRFCVVSSKANASRSLSVSPHGRKVRSRSGATDASW
jgi:hypothetical protein